MCNINANLEAASEKKAWRKLAAAGENRRRRRISSLAMAKMAAIIGVARENQCEKRNGMASLMAARKWQ
jgi:hypothetical protein